MSCRFGEHSCVGNFCFVFVGEIFKRRHLHFRNPSGQWWGQFAEMDKFSFLVNFRSIHSIHSTVQYTTLPEWDKKKLISKYVDHKKSQKITKYHKISQKITKNRKKSQKITTCRKESQRRKMILCGEIRVPATTIFTKNHNKSHKITQNKYKKSQKKKFYSQQITKNHKNHKKSQAITKKKSYSQTITKNHKKKILFTKNHTKSQKINPIHKKSQVITKKKSYSQKITNNHKKITKNHKKWM